MANELEQVVGLLTEIRDLLAHGQQQDPGQKPTGTTEIDGD